MKIRQVSVLIILLVFYSCNRINKSEAIFTPDSVKDLYLAGSYNLSAAQVMNPQSIKLNLDNIYILDEVPDHIFKLIDNKGKLITSFGRIGSGPDEFNQITTFFIRNRNCIDIYDQGKKRLVRLEGFNNLREIWENKKSFDVVTAINDSLFACAAVYDSASIYLINMKGEIIDQSYYFPPKKEDIPLLSHSMAMSGLLEGTTNSSYLAKVAAFDGGIDIFQIEQNKIIHKWRFSNFSMEYDIIKEYNNVPSPNNNTRRGYIDLFMGENNIYALYSGERFLDPGSSSGSIIHIFDKVGKQKSLLSLEKHACKFTIDEENNILYAIRRENDEHEILYLDKYNLD